MVKTRVSSFTNQQRSDTKEILKNFGRNDITLKTVSETYDEHGKIITTSYVDSTITGDLQYGPEAKKVLETFGHAQTGDGVFFCSHEVSLNEEDIITVDSVDWELTEKRNLPTTGGPGAAHQEWLVRRIV